MLIFFVLQSWSRNTYKPTLRNIFYSMSISVYVFGYVSAALRQKWTPGTEGQETRWLSLHEQSEQASESGWVRKLRHVQLSNPWMLWLQKKRYEHMDCLPLCVWSHSAQKMTTDSHQHFYSHVILFLVIQLHLLCYTHWLEHVYLYAILSWCICRNWKCEVSILNPKQ